jgi:talin
MLGITRDSVLKMDPHTKEVLFTFPLKTVKRWAASPTSFTVDFGDHQDEYQCDSFIIVNYEQLKKVL